MPQPGPAHRNSLAPSSALPHVHRYRPERPSALLVLSILIGIVGGCDTLPGEVELGGNLVERLQRKQEFRTLTQSLERTGLAPLLHSDQPRTVLAPTDIAFEYLGGDVLGTLSQPANTGAFTRVLRHHIIDGRLGPDDFVDGDTLRSIDGRLLPVRRIGPVVRVGGATLDLSDATEAEGSVAYPIADVLLGALTSEERVRLSPSLSRFRAYAEAAGLLDRAGALPSATILAPLNDAIEALGGVGPRLFTLTSNTDVLQRTLDFHVVPGVPDLVGGQALESIGGDPLMVRAEGGVWTVGGRRVLRDEQTADGRLLILGGVVLDPLSIAQRLRIEPAPLTYWREVQDRLPDLWGRFGDDRDALTVFAPTDFAYQLRGAALNNALSDATNAALVARILQVHVVEGALTPDDLTDGRELVTVDGTVIQVGRDGDRITLDGRRLGEARATSNGVLYTFDAFVLPSVDALDTALLRGFTEHVLAVRKAGLEPTFRAPGVTAFLASNDLYALDPARLQTNPRPFLLHNATTASIPTLGATTFTTLDGTARQIRVVPCPDGTDPDVPADDLCSPFQLEDGTQVYQGSPAIDGTGYLHSLRTLSYPTGF